MTSAASLSDARGAERRWPLLCSRRGFWSAVLLLWSAASILYLHLAGERIESGVFGGPDDQLRLVQVRDFLAGQGWFDVSQHRMNVPGAAPMHWSRLVDLPIAGLILLAEPLVGREAAELFAMTAVPLLMMLAVALLLAASVRRLLGATYMPAALLLMVCSPMLYVQLRPLRIDHHGWQIALGVAAVTALLCLKGRRAFGLAGLAMAASLHVSIEGLPFAAAIAALLAFRAWRERERTYALLWYLGSLCAASVALFVMTQPATNWGAGWCDAITPAYLGGFTAAFVACLPLKMAWAESPVRRAAILSFAGAMSAASLVAINPQCAAGPFGSLDPVVHDYWYLRVQEGLPVWTVHTPLLAVILSSYILAAAGYAVAIQRAGDRVERRRWITMSCLFAAAALVGIFVTRASAFGMLLAIPGVLVLLGRTMRLAERVRPPWRVFVMFAVLLLFVPYTPGVAVVVLQSSEEAEDRSDQQSAQKRCQARSAYAALAALPAARILSPLDSVPAMLAATPHSFVASGHHRNADAIRDVITAFMAPTDAEARALVARRGLTHVVICRDTNELRSFMKAAPGSFAEQLNAGQVPDWLHPLGAESADDAVTIYEVRG